MRPAQLGWLLVKDLGEAWLGDISGLLGQQLRRRDQRGCYGK